MRHDAARTLRFSGLLLLLAGASAKATYAQSRAATDPVFVRAQEMVSEGSAAAGRALVDSIVNATPPASPRYAEALFWRAALSARASDAERDYRVVVVDFPLSPRAEEALLRLAQLQLARGDREGALTHLRRLRADYPGSRSQARASYWMARVLMEKNEVSAACSANAAALTQAAATEVELRNQIQYLNLRCPSPAPSASAAPGASSSLTPPLTPPLRAPGTNPSTVPPAIVTAPPAQSPVRTESPRASSPRFGWSVQVAAYNTSSEAERFAATLEARGFDARVDGTVKPFRVRVGRYATAAEATAALRTMKAKRIDGFVTRAP